MTGTSLPKALRTRSTMYSFRLKISGSERGRRESMSVAGRRRQQGCARALEGGKGSPCRALSPVQTTKSTSPLKCSSIQSNVALTCESGESQSLFDRKDRGASQVLRPAEERSERRRT